MPDLYAALFTRIPEEGHGGEEVTGEGYARVPIGKLDMQPGNHVLVNKEQVTFPGVRGSWGTITGFGIFGGDGRLYVSGSLSGGINLHAGDTLNFPPNGIAVSAEFFVRPDPPSKEPKPTPKTLWERLDEDD